MFNYIMENNDECTCERYLGMTQTEKINLYLDEIFGKDDVKNNNADEELNTTELNDPNEEHNTNTNEINVLNEEYNAPEINKVNEEHNTNTNEINVLNEEYNAPEINKANEELNMYKFDKTKIDDDLYMFAYNYNINRILFKLGSPLKYSL